jgi:hypothetical protein
VSNRSRAKVPNPEKPCHVVVNFDAGIDVEVDVKALI